MLNLRKNGALKLGIIGTAKNTGKTTTLAALLSKAHMQNISVAVTSIGYDGESIDNLTLLPKPRLDVHPGMIVATADSCIKGSNVRYEVLEDARENTSLGKIQIIRILSEGRLILAGPNNTDAVICILELLEKHASLVFIDGALGRMVPMSAADAVIFATGASRSTNIRHLASEMKAIEDIFHLGKGWENENFPERPDNITLMKDNGEKKDLGFSSLLNRESGEILWSEWPANLKTVVIPGAVSHHILDVLTEKAGASVKDAAFVFHSPATLLASGKPLLMQKSIHGLLDRGAGIGYIHPLPILGVTINPFYPRSVGRRGVFEAAYVDAEELRRQFSLQLDLPVYNIIEDGPDELFSILKNPG